MVAIQVYDSADFEIPDLGIIKVTDAETGQKFWMNTADKKQRDSFKEQALDKQKSLDRELKKSGIDSVRIATNQDIVKPLIKLFKER